MTFYDSNTLQSPDLFAMDGTGFVGPRIEISERLPELGAEIHLDLDQKASG